MKALIKNRKILRYFNKKIKKVLDSIVIDNTLRVIVNKKEIVIPNILLDKVEYFVYGFLYTNGWIRSIKDIVSLEIFNDICKVKIKNSVVNSAKEKIINGNFEISHKKILELLNKFKNMSEIYIKTGGVHSCALSDEKDIIIFAEDISRHNAFDKVIGEGLFKNLNFKDKLIITSGRVTPDIIKKIATVEIPIIASISAATYGALKLAESFNITLIGFARDEKFNIYTHWWRII